MSSGALEEFKKYKQEQSQFLSLAEDGESAVVKILDMKTIKKIGFGGDEIVVLRLICETLEGQKKFFDSGQKRWAEELTKKEVKIGNIITIVRHGTKGSPKTYYEVTAIEK